MTPPDRIDQPATGRDDEQAGSGPADQAPRQAMLEAAIAHRGLRERAKPQLVRRMRAMSRVRGIAIMVIGAAVILGWFAGLTEVTSFGPGSATMKFNTAVGFVLVGLAIVTLGRGEGPMVIVGRVVAVVAGLVGLATLVEWAFGLAFGFDNPFGFDPGAVAPGRMAIASAGCFVAIAVAVLSLGTGHPRVGQLAAMAVLAVGAFAVIGYFFGVSSLYAVGALTPMALHTALTFVIAGTAMLTARPDEGFMTLITGNTIGGITVRRMLVPALAGPLVLGALIDWAARAGTFTVGFGLAVFTIATVVLSTILVWVIGASLRHVDLRRAGAEDAFALLDRAMSEQKVAETALHESEARTKTSLDHMLDGFAILRSVRRAGAITDFEWTYINPAGAASYGRRVEDLVGTRMRTIVPSCDDSGAFAELCRVVDTGEVRSKLQSEYDETSISGVFDSLSWRLDDGVAVTWRDVTDREQAIAAVRSSEERFRASVEHLYESLSVFTAIRDESGVLVDFRWVFANSAAAALTGYEPCDLEGRTLLGVLPDHGPSGMFANYGDVVATGRPYIDPALWYEDTWGDGRRRRRAFDVRATRLDDGFVVVTREITQQREQEDERARQQFELERSNTEMRLLNGLADMLQSCATSDEAYSVVTQSCARLFSEFSGAISVMRPSQDVLERQTSWGDTEIGRSRFAPADCWALRRGRAHLSGAVGPRCAHLSAGADRQCLCLPMVGQSEAVGVFHLLGVARDDEAATVDADLEGGPARRLATTVAAQLSMAFANLRLRDSLREMSIRDPLTGLFNRRYMEETLNRELSQANRAQSELGIIAIDVDHFKAFNDGYGHDAGDAILEAVGAVFTRYSRTSDVVCRFGGEEFIIILPNCSLDDARLRAEDLRDRVSDLRVPYHQIELSAPTISCGVAGYPGHATTPEALIHLADRGLYMAKARGRDQVATAPFESSHAGSDLL